MFLSRNDKLPGISELNFSNLDQYNLILKWTLVITSPKNSKKKILLCFNYETLCIKSTVPWLWAIHSAQHTTYTCTKIYKNLEELYEDENMVCHVIPFI